MSSAQQRQHTQQAVVDVVAYVAAPSVVAYAYAAVSAVLADDVVALQVVAYPIAAFSSVLAIAAPSPALAWPDAAVLSAGGASNLRQGRSCALFSIGLSAF